MNPYHVIGIMSGTSLDGVDIAFCQFHIKANRWTFKILNAHTYSYTDEWTLRLKEAYHCSGLVLSQLHSDYGHYLGQLVNHFMLQMHCEPDFIASHGHTVFHQPDKKMTLQIGNGAALAAETGLPAVCDFRTMDVALGGQGAPLVPIGDQMLFPTYWYCLNLGGFANISFQHNGKRIAGDICPVNFVLNMLSARLGYACDPGGQLARSGSIAMDLLSTLNALDFYVLPPPKSLGREWVMRNILPLIDKTTLPVNDLLRTYTEHAAIQIARLPDQDPLHRMIVTGGGVYNAFLIERIRSLIKNPVIIPDDQIIQYKEALIFAFLGVLRIRNEVNCLGSVTGAREDSSGGAVYLP